MGDLSVEINNGSYDFVINNGNKKKIEIKNCGNDKSEEKEEEDNRSLKQEWSFSLGKQLFGELLWYGKVMYTDGLVWKYLEVTKCCNGNNIRSIVALRQELYAECVEFQWKQGKKRVIRTGTQAQWYNKIAKMQENENLSIKIKCTELANLTEAFNDAKEFAEKDKQLSFPFAKAHFDEWFKLKKELAKIDWTKAI